MLLILASQSPRRKDLLVKLLHDINAPSKAFTTLAVDLDESRKLDEPPLDYVKRMAREKFECGIQLIFNNKQFQNEATCMVITADTIVTLDNDVLGKPSSPDEATQMLKRLSGRTHDVITAFTVGKLNLRAQSIMSIIHDHVLTTVTFRTLSNDEIAEYCASNEPYDKAGGYGIQGFAGAFVDGISGSLNNVVGLPTEKLQHVLTSLTES